MRTRETSTKTTQTTSTTVIVGSSSSTVSGEVAAVPYEYAIMHDTVTPKFRKLQGKGKVIVNNCDRASSLVTGSGELSYTWQRYRLDPETGIWRPYMDGTSVEVTAGFSPLIRLPGLSVAETWADNPGTVRTSYAFSTAYSGESAALARVIANATSSETLAMVSIAELDKTFDLIFSLGKRANWFATWIESLTYEHLKLLKTLPPELLEKFRRMRPKARRVLVRRFLRDGVRSAPALAAIWLEYRYGIMATYYDISSWVQAKNSVGTSRRARFVSRFSSSYDSGYSTTVETANQFYESTTRKRYRRKTDSSVGCLVQLDLDVGHLESHGAFRLLSSGWELVPYSFVLDWFIDVGTRIAALEGRVLRPVLGSWVTHRHTLSYEASFETANRDWVDGEDIRYVGFNDDNAFLSEVATVYERKANPRLSAIPQLNIKLNWKRLADGLALLSTAAKRARTYW